MRADSEYRVVPFEKLSIWRQLRVRFFHWGDTGVYMSDQYGDIYWDANIGSPSYKR